MWLGDFVVGATIHFTFTTRRFSTGAPFALDSGTIRVYKDNGTTEDDSGITLSADFDGRTGLNHVAIDTSSDGTFYSAGGQFHVVITVGTVDSVSVVGETVGRFRLLAAEGDVSDILSRLTVTNSQLLIVKSDTSDIKSMQVRIISDTTHIHSDTTTLASDLAEGDFSDILSRLTLIHSETTAIQGIVSDIQSDTNVMVPLVSDIQSDTNKLVSDATEVDTSDLHSRLTLVLSDVSDILSRLVVVHSETTAIQSDTTTLASDLAEADFSDIHSLATKIYSDTTAIEAAGGALTAAQASQLSQIHSDQASQFAVVEPFVSDIYSDTTAIHTQTTAIASQVLIVKSDTSDIKSMQTKIYSDTTLATDAAGEPGQGDPPASATPMDKTSYLYKAWRNKTEQTSTEYSLYNDAGDTVDQKATVSDDTTTFTREEVGTGA
jgi:hypothetical protein